MADSPQKPEVRKLSDQSRRPRRTKRNRFDQALSALVAIAAITLAATSVIATFVAANASSQRTKIAMQDNSAEMALFRLKLENMEARTVQMQEQLKALSESKIPAQTKLAAQVNSMDESVKRIDGQLNELQNVIQDDPAKALRLPLMARDLQSLRDANEASANGLRQDIDRQYDLMKFIVGTLALSILGTLATVWVSLFKGRGSREIGASE